MPKRNALTKTGRVRGATTNIDARYATDINPNLEQWRVLAAEWLASLDAGTTTAMQTIRKFLVAYVHNQGLAVDPAQFFKRGYSAPCFYATCLTQISHKKAVIEAYGHLARFLDYVLNNYFSVEDDLGKRIVPPDFCSPVPPLPATLDGHLPQPQESVKNVLPYRFIEELRNILCPKDALHFSDWTWAASAGDTHNGGDWFVVPHELIDATDPDCIWRTRTASEYERSKLGLDEIVYEMWSPVVAVALYVKLELPLRSYQVRMLDSGEADTWRYVRGQWTPNNGQMAKGTEKYPCRRGVFRRIRDDANRVDMTGLFINTNKTSDIGKGEWATGYEVPWEHKKVLHWLEKLRNWQAKYNPIIAPMPWTSLERRHVGYVKSFANLKAMGSTCFLFRDAVAEGGNRFKPIAAHGPLSRLWYTLLAELESRCESRGEKSLCGTKLIFVKLLLDRSKSPRTTYYPLHALRVSLITAFALEGGVPMPILSKCIAGHARLVMTLYYTKAGITYVTELMTEAEKRLLEQEQVSYLGWLKDATYKDIEANTAYFNPAAIQAYLQARENGASLVRDDKGICAKGGCGCDSGGVFVNEDDFGIAYGAVPGYPEKNCVRCRWFFTGPAFLTGLHSHWNFVHLQLADVGERIVKLESQITALEDEQYECQANDRTFPDYYKLNTLRKIHQVEIERNDKFANDSSATLRLITRCKALVQTPQVDDGIRLVAAGSLSDVQIAISECDKLQQLLTAVAGSTVFPEHDVRKAALQAGRAYDLMLAMNGKSPIFFRLTEDELLPSVQQMTKLLQAEAGSIKEALPFVECSRRLVELGLDVSIDNLTRDLTSADYVEFAPARISGAPLIRIHQLPKAIVATQGDALDVK